MMSFGSSDNSCCVRKIVNLLNLPGFMNIRFYRLLSASFMRLIRSIRTITQKTNRGMKSTIKRIGMKNSNIKVMQ